MLEEGLKRLTLLKEDATRLAARDLHELMRAWEQYHRILSGEAHLRHILFREESRYPGYYYRSDFLSIDDNKWRVFTISQYNKNTNEWKFETEPYKQLVEVSQSCCPGRFGAPGFSMCGRGRQEATANFL